MSGFFLAFEGGEGAGKSTQARLLADALRRTGVDVVLTHEPGATELGRALRRLLLTGAAPVAARAEALLYAADRAQHVAEVIRPALHRGAVVISDRYAGSSLAYQGAARGLGRVAVEQLADFATQGLWPDATVLLDLDPAVGLRRAGRAGAPDRFESETSAFHGRVRACFLALADEQQWIVVDATADPPQVHERIVAELKELAPS